MARNILVDAGFLVALLSSRDTHHKCAASQVNEFAPPWSTCEAVLSEVYHLLGESGRPAVSALLRRRAVGIAFEIAQHIEPITKLMEKYSAVPMSLADACLVRMTEVLADPMILTTDHDFRIYRRHSRQVVPCAMPE
jgi:uncharacterized protein